MTGLLRLADSQTVLNLGFVLALALARRGLILRFSQIYVRINNISWRKISRNNFKVFLN